MGDKVELNISIPGLLIINGMQGMGKSHLIRYLMYVNRKKFDWGIVFTNTGSYDETNFDYVPKEYVHPRYSKDILLGLKNIHAKLLQNGKKPSAFIIFDDCLTGEQWKDPEFVSAMTQVRHLGFTCIISTQYPQAIPPIFRSNIFQTAIFRMRGPRALKALYEEYGQSFDNYAEFMKFMKAGTGDYNFIFFDGRSTSEEINELYKIHKCPAELPKFMLKFKDKI